METLIRWEGRGYSCASTVSHIGYVHVHMQVTQQGCEGVHCQQPVVNESCKANV